MAIRCIAKLPVKETYEALFSDLNSLLWRNLIDEWVGPVDYGRLFAYLHRRFGYPNWGWDDYKELVRYMLATSRPDMVLSIVPHLSMPASFQFSFMVPRSVSRLIRDYDNRDVIAHAQRMCDWIESEGLLPNWMDSWIKQVQAEVQPKAPTVVDWRCAFEYLWLLAHQMKEPFSIWFRWYKDVTEQYFRREARPQPLGRTIEWQSWPDDDPAKPYVEAARKTLLSLRQGVRVRDQAIDMHGPVECARVNEYRGAGWGVPEGIRTHPALAVELDDLVHRIGHGNFKAGFRMIRQAFPETDCGQGPSSAT
ncbi:MAG: hypothetical protein ACYDAG_02535 [Chloroflexota bacterium]